MSFQERALEYLSTCIDQVNTFGDILQLVIVELIYKVFKNLNNALRDILSIVRNGKNGNLKYEIVENFR